MEDDKINFETIAFESVWHGFPNGSVVKNMSEVQETQKTPV